MRRNASKSEIHDYSRKSIQDARQRIARRLHEPMDEEASHPKDTRNLAKRLSDESHGFEELMWRNASRSEIHDYSRKSIQDARQRLSRYLQRSALR